MTLFSGKNSIFTPKISDDQVFRFSPFFSQIFRICTMLNVVYDPFPTRRTPFFTLFILSRASDNTTSQNSGVTDAWAVLPPKICGGRPPSPPYVSPPPIFKQLN